MPHGLGGADRVIRGRDGRWHRPEDRLQRTAEQMHSNMLLNGAQTYIHVHFIQLLLSPACYKSSLTEKLSKYGLHKSAFIN